MVAAVNWQEGSESVTGQQAEKIAVKLVGTTEAAINRLGMNGAREAMQTILVKMGFDEAEAIALAKVLLSIVAEKGKLVARVRPGIG